MLTESTQQNKVVEQLENIHKHRRDWAVFEVPHNVKIVGLKPMKRK